MKLDMSFVMFTDATRDPDGCANICVYFGDEHHQHLQHRQQGLVSLGTDLLTQLGRQKLL